HVAAEIGGQHFDARIGQGTAHLTYRFSKVSRAAVAQIVAIDGCNDDVAELHSGRHARYVRRLCRVESELSFLGRAFWNRAESAAARAEVAEDHERRGAAVEAFMHVGAARGFTDRKSVV